MDENGIFVRRPPPAAHWGSEEASKAIGCD